MNRWFNNFRSNILTCFAPSFREGELGATGGSESGGTGAVVDSGSSGESEAGSSIDGLSATDLGISEDEFKNVIESDPNLKSIIEKKSEASKKEGEDKGGDGENVDTSTGEEAELDSSETDENTGSETDESASGFADNVIQGVSGEDFEKLSEGSQVALGEFYQKAQESTEKLTQTEQRLQKLISDPVVAARVKALDAGNDKALYEVRGLTQAEKGSIKNLLKAELSLDDEEADKALNLLGKGLEVTAHQMAQSIVNNLSIAKDNENKVKETIKKGQDILIGLGAMNKTLSLKEKDLNNILKQGDKHPEFKQYSEGLGKVYKWCQGKGLNYNKIVEQVETFGIESFYAAVAKDLGLPVVLNAAGRDQTIIKNARLAALKPFFKGGSTGTMSTDRGSAGVDSRTAQKTLLFDGYDTVKLASDPAYFAKAVEKKPGDLAHLEKIENYAAKGRASLDKRKKR